MCSVYDAGKKKEKQLLNKIKVILFFHYDRHVYCLNVICLQTID